MLAILPLLLAACSFGIWYLIKRIYSHSIDFQARAMSTLIIVLFLVHPSIVQYMFYDFKCMNVDGTNRLEDDL